MDAVTSVLAIAGAVTLGAMSPGPSFVLVARTAVSRTRADGLAAAAGMGLGAVAFAVAALLGLHVVLTAVPWLHLALKILGGGYLVWLGWRIWRGAKSPLVVAADAASPLAARPARSFLLGLVTQLSNPKTAVVYAGIFSALLPREVPPWVSLTVPAVVLVIETVWYAVVAVALSAAASRQTYLRAKAGIDRAAGGVMALLGARLIASLREV